MTQANNPQDNLCKKLEIIKSGYGGIDRNGQIVDRREFPEAVPLQENKLLNTPKPKDIETTN